MTRQYTRWRTSRHSEPNGHCVEVGRADDGTIGVRDSRQHGQGPVLELSVIGWAMLVRKIRHDQLGA